MSDEDFAKGLAAVEAYIAAAIGATQELDRLCQPFEKQAKTLHEVKGHLAEAGRLAEAARLGL